MGIINGPSYAQSSNSGRGIINGPALAEPPPDLEAVSAQLEVARQQTIAQFLSDPSFNAWRNTTSDPIVTTPEWTPEQARRLLLLLSANDLNTSLAPDAFGTSLGDTLGEARNGSTQASDQPDAETARLAGTSPGNTDRDAFRQSGIAAQNGAGSVAGSSYVAQSGDSISKILGTSDPQAIGNFMRANGLTSSTIKAGQNYFLPEYTSAYGDSSGLGQNTLNTDNARLAAIAQQHAADQLGAWDAMRFGRGGPTGPGGPIWHIGGSSDADSMVRMDNSAAGDLDSFVNGNPSDRQPLGKVGRAITSIGLGATKAVGLGLAELPLEVADVATAAYNVATGSDLPVNNSMLGKLAANGGSTKDLLWETTKNVASVNPVVAVGRAAFNGTQAAMNGDWEGVGAGAAGVAGSFGFAKSLGYGNVGIELPDVPTIAGTGRYQSGAMSVPKLVKLDGATSGPVVFRAPPGATAEEIAQVRACVDGSNEALQAGHLSPTGRVSTAGDLRTDASLAAAQERARAAAQGVPYQGHAGHVPDTTWTGNPQPYSWLDLSPRVNSSLGGQAPKYPVGYQPTEFIFEGPL